MFSEVDPGQKERIVAALRAAGHVVAYLGDGINDAPALRAADVGLSVDSAADVAREAADVVLRRRDLGVVANGVREGRRTMVNTLKYVYYTTSANFGNMLSMAVASLFLPFLPLLPKQILLNNFLSDIPAVTIAADRVDEASVRTRAPFWRSRPGTGVLVSTVVIAGVAVGLPYTAPGRLFGFASMPLELLAAVLAITCAYIVATEVTKQWFFRSRPS